MTEYFGNRRTAADTSYRVAEPGTNNQRANIFGPFPEDGWATHMSIWGGSEGSNPDVQLAVWGVEDKTDVVGRRAYTDTFTPSAAMLSASGGASYTAALTHMNSGYSPSDLAMSVSAGEYYALGFLALTNNFPHAINTDDQKALHRASVANGVPTSPFNATETGTSGELDIWMTYEPNTAPDVPTNLSPNTDISTQSPTLEADWSDNDSVYGDYLKAYRIQLRVVGTTGALLINQTFTATTSERTAGAISRAIPGGVVLSAGVEYEWRVKAYDHHDAESDYSDWAQFEITTGVGTLTTTGSTPNGKQDAVNGLIFEAHWNHSSALTLTDVMIEIRQRGIVSQKKEYTLAAPIASSTAPGTYFTVDFDDVGFTDLIFGEVYSWRIKGKDSAGIYSAWTTSIDFTTNTTPDKPGGMTPARSQSVSDEPTLKMQSDDEDDTPVAAGGLMEATCYIYHQPHIPNVAFTSTVAGWTASNSGDNAGATATWTWGNSDISGDGWGLDGYMQASISASTALAGVVYHSDLGAVWAPCVVGASYSVEGEYLTTVNSVQGEIYIKWYNSSRVLLSTSAQASFTPRVTFLPNYMKLTATAPANAAYYQIGLRLRTTNNNQTGTVYFKNVQYDGASLRNERAMTWNALTERWNYQTVAGTDDVQTITKTGTVTGGTWSFTFNGAAVAGIPHNASAATVEALIEALSTVGAGNVSVATHGTGSGGWVVTFVEQLAGTYQNIASVSSSLTGTTPGIGIVHTTNGASNDVGPTGKYWWDAETTDTINTSERSELEAFFFVTGPVVVITSHTDQEVITHSNPTITWTASNQATYTVDIYLEGTSTRVHTSGEVTSAVQSYAVPVGTLRNNTNYDVQVSVENTSGIDGQSEIITLQVSMSAPDELAFTASERFVGLDADASAVTLGWEHSDVSPDLFERYIIGRRETGDDVDHETILRYITNINQNTFIDYFPETGVDYTYTLRQSKRASASSETVVESNAAEAAVTLGFTAVVIASVNYPSARRAVLRFVTDRSNEHKRNTTILPTWGNRAPVILQDQTNYQIVTGTFTVVADTQGSALEYMDTLRNLWNNGDTCCYRDERGRKLFGLITDFKEKDMLHGQYTVDLTFTEADYEEGE